MKVFFLLNPSNPKRLWDLREVAGQVARRHGVNARFGQVERTRPGSTEHLVKQALDDGCERLVVVGGDGSLHRVVNALQSFHALRRLPIAVVPGGTCNDFARLLGFSSKQPEEAFRVACLGSSREIDLGQMDKELFLNNAGFGRRRQAPSARRMRGLRSLRTFQPTPLVLKWDKGTLEGDFYMALACNAPFFSGGLYFSKSARLCDGLLDVYLVPRMPKWRLLSRLVLGRLGRPVTSRHMITLRAARVEFEAQADLWPQADGEPAPVKAARRVTFGVAAEKAMIVIPDTKSQIFWS